MPPKHVAEAERIAAEHDAAVAGQPPAQPPAEPPAPAPEAAPPAPDLTPPPPSGDDGDWQQKYQTLKGKFDSEVPRLSNELRETRGQLNEVLTRLDSMQPPQQAQPQPAPEPPAPLVTDEDIENYGPELADFIRRQATVVASGITADLREENAQLRQQVEQVGASTGQVQVDRYLSRLKELVPDYETINVDQRFLNWLGEMDQMAGVPRQAFLNTAFEARDPDRTATLFNTFKEQAGIAQPAPTPPAPRPQNGNGQVPAGLENQISPNAGSGGGVSPGGDAEQIWTAADIRNFTNDILRGTYKGREGEQEAIQAAIDAAIATGRVRA